MKKKTEEWHTASEKRSGLRHVIYSKYSTYAQEAREQIEFFLACFIRMNTGLTPLFNIKPCIHFHIESNEVVLVYT